MRSDVAAFLKLINASPAPKTHEVTPPVARMMMRAMCDLAELPVGDLAVNRKIEIPGSDSDISRVIPAQVFDTREVRGPGPVMVFYHGGGFVIGDLYVYESYCAEVARLLDIPVISIDYRLAPEHPFPAATDDCEAATRWIATSPAELGYDITGLITSGDSAGGNLTIVTTMALRDNPAAVPVILQHPIYPGVASHGDWQSVRDFADGHFLTIASMGWFTRHYQPEMTDYRGAPLSFNQSGMPPSLVTTASHDPLRDQGIAYVEALEKAGVTVQHISAEGNIHGHITLRKAIPSAQSDVERNMKALQSMLADILPRNEQI
jgi:acetyl esterase